MLSLFRVGLFVILVGPSVVFAGSCGESKLCCPGRDSSCVVQKAPLNSIIEDLSDKPCYCDHACLKLGDCCYDFKESCGVIDCQVSPWGAWSNCDAECGSGTMSRTRSVVLEPQNGGRHCPSLQQRRGCQVSNCHHHHDHAIKEMALLLPGILSKMRKVNQTTDIRRNLQISFPDDHPEFDVTKEYCVEFEVLKASKGCKNEEYFNALKEGERVCVRCESEALRKNLGWRCQGHGVAGLVTRWSAMTAPHCHGKWLRPQHANDPLTCASGVCANATVTGEKDTSFIFV